jgi:hypothetical protein
MRRAGLLGFNVGLAVVVAALYAAAVNGAGFGPDALAGAFASSWWAGFVVGGTVGVGATFGPRPVLPLRKCLLAQAGVVLSSAIGGFIGSLFPSEFSAADRALEAELARRGILTGSWIGAAVGTVFEVGHVYFMRRRAARPK